MTDPQRDRWLEPGILSDPYAYMAALRTEEPVSFSPSLGAFMVTRYADVSHVLRSPEIFASQLDGKGSQQANFDPRFAAIYAEAGVPQLIPTLQSSDGPVHKRYRTMVDSTFNASTVRSLDSEVRGRVNSLIDQFIERGNVDIYADFCMQLPLYVICDLAGIPHDLTPHLRASANAMVRLVMPAHETADSVEALHRDQAAFQKAILEVIRDLRGRPDDAKLISRLIETPTADGSFLTDQEIMSLVTVLNVGGNETTTNGLGNMFHLCFTQPGREQELREDRALIDKFLEEALRVESPVACLPRRVTRDTEIDGVAIPEGSIVLANFASANRDENKFACPHQVELDRTGMRNHMAFGAGVHFCLGAILSRLEMSASMNIILDRMQNIRLDPAAVAPEREHKFAVRAFDTLPILFEKRDDGASEPVRAAQ